MTSFKTTKEAIDFMQCEGYDPEDFNNDCCYQPESWERIEELLNQGQELHTTVGDWQYFKMA